MKLERVEIEDLNVGDKVCVAYETRWGWSRFRYPTFIKATVKRITPKKTKMVTDVCGDCDRHTPIYRPNEETTRQTTVALAYKKILDIVYLLNNSNEVSIKNLKDETILKLCDLMKEAEKLVKDDIDEQQAK